MTVLWPSLSPDGSVVPALPSDEASSGALFLLSSHEDGLWWKEAQGSQESPACSMCMIQPTVQGNLGPPLRLAKST